MTGWWKACRGHRHASAGGRDGVRAARGGRVRRGERHSHERAAFSYARSLWWARRVRLASGGHVVGTGTPSGEDKREWRSNVAEDAQERFRGWGCREQVRFDSATRRPMLISSTLGRAARSITVLPGGGRRRRGKGRARGWTLKAMLARETASPGGERITAAGIGTPGGAQAGLSSAGLRAPVGRARLPNVHLVGRESAGRAPSSAGAERGLAECCWLVLPRGGSRRAEDTSTGPLGSAQAYAHGTRAATRSQRGRRKLGTQHKQELTPIIAWWFHVKHSLAKTHLQTARPRPPYRGCALKVASPNELAGRSRGRIPWSQRRTEASSRAGATTTQAHRARRTLPSVLCGGGPSPGQWTWGHGAQYVPAEGLP